MRIRHLVPVLLVSLCVMGLVASATPVSASPQWPYGPYRYPYPMPPYGPYGPYGYGRYDYSAALRLEVKPKEAEVFVDGYRAGIVDDFDGLFQRLFVRPGGHELVFYLDGYRATHESIYVEPNAGRTIKLSMTPLGAGEAQEARPVAPAGGQPPESAYPAPDRPQPPVRPGPPQPMPPAEARRFGSVSIRVVPVNADVFVDGARWRAPSALDPIVVRLSEGRHTVEIQRTGYEPYSSEIEIRAGETETLNVSLKRVG